MRSASVIATASSASTDAGDVFSAVIVNRAIASPQTCGEVLLHGGHTVLVQPVHPSCPHRLLHHEPRLLQQAEVTRHRGPADRQRVGELADRRRAGTQPLDDGPAVRIAQRLERIARRLGHGHAASCLAGHVARIRLLRALCSTSARPSRSSTGGT